MTSKIKAHLENELECRWCFAVDRKRVEAKVIKEYHFHDAILLHLKCPRCGGEFSYYSPGFDERYLRGIISKLHPELANISSESKRFEKMVDLVFPEYQDC